MEEKQFKCLIAAGLLLAAVFLIGKGMHQSVTTSDRNYVSSELKESSLLSDGGMEKSSEQREEIAYENIDMKETDTGAKNEVQEAEQPDLYSYAETERSGEQEGIELSENMTVASMSSTNTSCELEELGYNLIEKEEAKEGEFEFGEMGLYWDRVTIQSTFYPDVQEICEEVFGDYLSPLQGLTGMLRHYDKRYRTDKQTAIRSPGRMEFYLFLQNATALVTIEERKETYYTSFRILREEEARGIRVLEVPPPGGIGIAGTFHKPETPNYATHTTATYEGELEYTKADIQLVFNVGLQRIAEETFGDYVEALQGLYMLAEQEGYGDSILFGVEDMATYRFEGHYETTILKENFCEFTLCLNYQDRARVTITKDGNQYITTFRLLKQGELETEVRAG